MDLHCLQMCARIYLVSEFTRLYPTMLDALTARCTDYFRASLSHVDGPLCYVDQFVKFIHVDDPEPTVQFNLVIVK